MKSGAGSSEALESIRHRNERLGGVKFQTFPKETEQRTYLSKKRVHGSNVHL
jgi:hypothetical protein